MDTGLSVTPLMGHLGCLASHWSVPVTKCMFWPVHVQLQSLGWTWDYLLSGIQPIILQSYVLILYNLFIKERFYLTSSFNIFISLTEQGIDRKTNWGLVWLLFSYSTFYLELIYYIRDSRKKWYHHLGSQQSEKAKQFNSDFVASRHSWIKKWGVAVLCK